MRAKRTSPAARGNHANGPTSIVRANSNPTNGASVDYTATFSEAVAGVDSSDFALTTTGVSGASITGVTGLDAIWTVTVDTGSGDGTIRLDVVDDDSISAGPSDPLGEFGAGNGNFTAGEIYDVDHNAPPVVDLDGLPSESVPLAYTENDGAKLIAPDGVVTDIDSSDFNTGKLTASFGSSGLPEDQLSILTDGTVTVSSGIVSVDGLAIGAASGGDNGSDLVIDFTTADATPAAVSTLIKHIAYLNNSEEPSTTARSVSFTVDDGDGDNLTGSDTATINVEAINDPPANTVPGPQTTDEDTPLTITGLQVSDVDIGSSNSITVTLSVDHGTIHVDPTVPGGLESFQIVDNDASSVTLSGDPALVNLTLTAGIVYTPAGDYNGSDTLTIATGDGGNTGTGGVQTDSDEIAITVGAQNDAPELTGLGDTASYTENGAAVVLDTDGNASVSDADLVETVAGATLTLARQEGANSEDVFGGSGQLDLTHSNESGENVSLDGGGDLHRHLQPAGGRHTLDRVQWRRVRERRR